MSSRLALTSCIVLFLMSCNTKNSSTVKTNIIFPKGQLAAENFTGTVHVQILTVDGEETDEKKQKFEKKVN